MRSPLREMLPLIAQAVSTGAETVSQVEMTGALLAERLLRLVGDGERRRRMAAAARALARPDAARVIVDRVEQLLGA